VRELLPWNYLGLKRTVPATAASDEPMEGLNKNYTDKGSFWNGSAYSNPMYRVGIGGLWISFATV
jgi:hypothetical protein